MKKMLFGLFMLFAFVSTTQAQPVISFEMEKVETKGPDPARRYAKAHKDKMYKPCKYKILFITAKRKSCK